MIRECASDFSRRYQFVTLERTSLAVIVVCLILVLLRSPVLYPAKAPGEILMTATLHGYHAESIAQVPNLSDSAARRVILTPVVPFFGNPLAISPLEVAAWLGTRGDHLRIMLDAGAEASDIALCLARWGDHGGDEVLLAAARPQANTALPRICAPAKVADRTLRLAVFGLTRTTVNGGSGALTIPTLPGTPLNQLAAGNRRAVEQALADGWSPAQRRRFTSPDGRFDRSVAPILVPVLLDDVSYVEMLLKAGAGASRDGVETAWCAAKRRNREGTLRVLATAVGAEPDCPDQEPAWIKAFEKALRQIRGTYF